MVNTIASLATRGFQLACAVVVLGLSIKTIQGQRHGSVPATNGYVAFVGAFGCLTSVLGIASTILSSFGSVVMAVIDSLTSMMFLAGGIALAAGMHGAVCSNPNSAVTWKNKLINGGCVQYGKQTFCGFEMASDLQARCHVAYADAAFLFIGAAVSIGSAVLCFLAMRKEKQAETPANSDKGQPKRVWI